MSAMATDGVAMDCFLDIYEVLSSTVRPREAAPSAHAALALSLTQVSNFLFKKSSVFLSKFCIPSWAGGMCRLPTKFPLLWDACSCLKTMVRRARQCIP